MTADFNDKREQLLEKIAENLDIAESKFEEAEKKYKAVGEWLKDPRSPLAKYNPEIYTQGSFRLGTVVRPITEEDEYDIDLVCELKHTKKEISQKDLKATVGDRLKEHHTYKKILEAEGKRCWTLNYSDGAQFHMDILPAIPDAESFRVLLASKGFSNIWSDMAVAITDKERINYTYIDDDWLTSNPRGYADWFKDRMRIRFDERRKLIAESLRASVENVPDYKVKTPLQRSVQILKRHRDVYFKDKQDLKPASIILTTLAAHAYNNESDLYEALINIVNGMEEELNKHSRDGIAVVLNPVNPTENFADRWKGKPELEKSCRAWIRKAKEEFNKIKELEDMLTMAEGLKKSLGTRVIEEAKSSSGLLIGAPAIIVHSRPQVTIQEPVKPWGD